MRSGPHNWPVWSRADARLTCGACRKTRMQMQTSSGQSNSILNRFAPRSIPEHVCTKVGCPACGQTAISPRIPKCAGQGPFSALRLPRNGSSPTLRRVGTGPNAKDARRLLSSEAKPLLGIVNMPQLGCRPGDKGLRTMETPSAAASQPTAHPTEARSPDGAQSKQLLLIGSPLAS